MKRVFFYTGFHMEVFEFDLNTLIGSLDFYDTNEGIDQLQEYLSQSLPAQSYLVVDLQDEDFRSEDIPHVNSRDRQHIISRLETKIFRDLQYHHTEALGRRRDGRKDDRYVFSSLLNVESLDKWMTIFSDFDVPICGIWSTSYLGERILKKIATKEENILLFSRQMRSAIRETVFKNTKIVISRQAKLERRIRKDRSAETLATILASNVDIMHRFLINQRMLNYTDTLNIYAIINDDLIKKSKEYCEDSNTLKFHFIGIQKLFSLFDLKNCSDREANTLFAYLCTIESNRSQQYLPVEHQASHHRFQLNLAVKNLCLALSVIFFVIASFLLLNANELHNKEEFFILKKNSLIEEHHRLYGDKQEQIDSSQKIYETVKLIKNIEHRNADTPQALFPQLSRIFEQKAHQRFNLKAFEWQKYHPQQLMTIASEYTDLSQLTAADDAFIENPTHEYGFQSVLTIQGKLDRRQITYQQAVLLMESFTKAVRLLPGVSEVHILQNPIDIRISSKFSDQRGILEDKNFQNMSNSDYELRIIFKSTRLMEGNHELATQ